MFRVTHLNLEQDHKRWDARRPLVLDEITCLGPDIVTLNEVCVPRQTARGLWRDISASRGGCWSLVQQTRVNGLADLEAEAAITRLRVIETANLDLRTRDIVALVMRVLVHDEPVDVYVTHLYMSRGDDALRLHQVQRLLAWIESRDDVRHRVVCGDFNATLDQPSASLMARHFRPSQTAPTAFTPLADQDGSISHPDRRRMDRCIDYIWVSGGISITASGVAFDRPSPADPTLWPSDHAGVWADLTLT